MNDPTVPPDLEGLDDELASLVDAERRHPGPPSGAASRVRATVLVTVAASAAAGSTAAAASVLTASSSSSAAGSAVAVASAGGAATGASSLVGAGVVAAAVAATVGGTVLVANWELDPPPAPQPVVVHEATPVAPMPPPGLVLTPVAPSTPSTPSTSNTPAAMTTATTATPMRAPPGAATPPATPPATPTATPTPAEQEAALAAERAVLTAARTALQRNEVTPARQHLEQHRRTWPAGLLAEEREALFVMTLARDDVDAARAAAARFKATYPTSIFLDAVSRALP